MAGKLRFGRADCATCGWKTNTDAKNAMGVAAQHANRTGHVATVVLEYAMYPRAALSSQKKKE